MIVDLNNLPEDGKLFEGEIPGEVFDLKDPNTKAASPLDYQLYVQRFDNELLLTGRLEATFELTCMRTLHPFLKTISLPRAAVSFEITEDSRIDVSDALREEILIELPTNPRCEDGDEEQTCEIDERYLALDKEEQSAIEPAPAIRDDDPWKALEGLSTQSDRNN